MGLNIFNKSEKEEQQQTSVADRYQISRKTAANARPAREKAGSVRMGGQRKQVDALMSKEEKEEIKRRDRKENDLRDGVANMMLKQNEAYQKQRRVWYFLLIFGLAMIAISYISLKMQTPGVVNWANYTSIITLIAAYASIFTAFFFDLGRIRPIRKEVFAHVSRLSLKQVENLAQKFDSEK